MSEAKHTPGPWQIDEGGSSISSDAVTDLAILNMINPRFLWGGSDYATKSHREANASLIAAAPDLLEALKALLHEVDESAIASAKDYGWPEATRKARAAIARAEGAKP